jgi:hypothetical protein
MIFQGLNLKQYASTIQKDLENFEESHIMDCKYLG